jgi:hypothetical protein
MKWEFQEVSGLAAVNTISTDPTGGHLLAGSASLRTLSLISFPANASSLSSADPESFDVLGSPVCESPPCLISKVVIQEDRDTPLSDSMPPNLLGGLRHVLRSARGEWVVQTGLPLSEMVCASDMPSTGVPEPGPDHGLTGVIELQLTHPPCQELSFSITGSGDLDMLSRMPRLHPNGTLTFSQVERGWGRALFNVRLDDHGQTDDPNHVGGAISSFFIDIAPVAALTFELMPADMLQVDADPRKAYEVVFAFNFSRARVPLVGLDIPRLQCYADVRNESLFARCASRLPTFLHSIGCHNFVF